MPSMSDSPSEPTMSWMPDRSSDQTGGFTMPRIGELAATPLRVLVLDDDVDSSAWVAVLLTSRGHTVRQVATGAAYRDALASWPADVALLDMILPDADGVELLHYTRSHHPDVEAIMITGHGSVSTAVRAMASGAFSFLEKPVDAGHLSALLDKVGERVALVQENRRLQAALEGTPTFPKLVAQSDVMKQLFRLMSVVAPTDANVLIHGENGTGKELIAEAIHQNSKRAGKPFIRLNCAAIPAELLESELFGHRKGSFTGAIADKVGLVELAHGGSLLLDEIGEMPSYLQAKLLRVLQEREFRPIGSDRSVRVDFRLICATNVDVEAALKDGRLREDLYFRINTITVRVPPLRDRLEDLAPLCQTFLAQYNTRHGRALRGVSPSAYHRLMQHRWPGNVRELENVIERGVLVARGQDLQPEDLPESVMAVAGAGPVPQDVLPPTATLAEIERMAILQALQRTNWNKQDAAQLLGLYRPTLYSKMKKHGITSPPRVRRRLAAETAGETA
jgi:DNA-binding NtrC family response regulator